MCTSQLDRLGVLEVAGGAKDQEEGVAVALELGALMRVDGILDRELVEAELPA